MPNWFILLKFHYDNTPAGSFVLLVGVKFCFAVVRDLLGCWDVGVLGRQVVRLPLPDCDFSAEYTGCEGETVWGEC